MKTHAAALALFLTVSACSRPASYHIYTTGYTGGIPTAIARGTPVAVVPNPRIENPLLEEEVLAETRRLLASAGYPVASIETARVAVYVNYGTGSHAETEQTSTFTPGAVSIIKDSTGKEIGRSVAPDVWGTSAETVNRNDWWLTLTAVDAAAMRAAGTAARPIWIGESRNSGADLDSRRMLAYLVLPAVERFGRNTPREHVTLREGDVRVRAMMLP